MYIPTLWQEKYADSVLDQMRHICDPLADAVAARLNRKRPSHMIDEVISRAASEGGPFSDYLDHAHTVPRWVNWDAIEHARRVNLAFANVRAISLLVSSLVEGYSLSKAAHVLVATGRLQQDVLKRVYETSQMVHNINVPDGIRPGGVGHRTMMEVRLLHAMVRKYLRQRGWDVARYDEPINQEDMAFTIIEFDYLAVRGMERMGVQLSDDDRAALHHLWRYGAYLNGVDDRMITETPAEEIYQYERIRDRQRSPNEESRALATTVVSALAGQPPFNLPEALLFELSRLCLGDELADIYQFPRHAGWQRAVQLYRLGNQLGTFAHYRVPGFDRLSQALNFRIVRKALLDNLDADPDKRAFRHIA